MSYYFDLHVHSKNSFDSSISFGSMIDMARSRDLTGLAITDHNQVSHFPGPVKDMIMIPGIEYRAIDVWADVILLGVQDAVPDELTLDQVLDHGRDHDCVVVIPHVFSTQPGYPALGENVYRISDRVDALEVTNPKSFIDNRRGRHVARSLGLGMVGGSDAHRVDNVGVGVTVLNDPPGSVDDVLHAIRNHETGGILRGGLV